MGAVILGLGTSFAIEGPVNTFLRAQKLFPGPHLYAGAGVVVCWAMAASLVPMMGKGKEAARVGHMAFNALALGLFTWQVTLGRIGYARVWARGWVCACGYARVGMRVWVCAYGYAHAHARVWVCACGYARVGARVGARVRVHVWVCAYGHARVWAWRGHARLQSDGASSRAEHCACSLLAAALPHAAPPHAVGLGMWRSRGSCLPVGTSRKRSSSSPSSRRRAHGLVKGQAWRAP